MNDRDNECEVGDIKVMLEGPYTGFDVEVVEINEDGTAKTLALLLPSDPERARQLREIMDRERDKRG